VSPAGQQDPRQRCGVSILFGCSGGDFHTKDRLRTGIDLTHGVISEELSNEVTLQFLGSQTGYHWNCQMNSTIL
jgi:hypothetical protein